MSRSCEEGAVMRMIEVGHEVRAYFPMLAVVHDVSRFDISVHDTARMNKIQSLYS
jgi:hypothetical protein